VGHQLLALRPPPVVVFPGRGTEKVSEPVSTELPDVAVPDYGLRVLVTGGRDYADADLVTRALTMLKATEVAQGGASGADRLAALWAHDNNVPCVTFPADWAKHGKAAGPIRNRQMLDAFRPDVVAAFPGGRGTAHMITHAEDCGVPVVCFPRREPTAPEGVV
jgi:hypothetical protein